MRAYGEKSRYAVVVTERRHIPYKQISVESYFGVAFFDDVAVFSELFCVVAILIQSFGFFVIAVERNGEVCFGFRQIAVFYRFESLADCFGESRLVIVVEIGGKDIEVVDVIFGLLIEESCVGVDKNTYFVRRHNLAAKGIDKVVVRAVIEEVRAAVETEYDAVKVRTLEKFRNVGRKSFGIVLKGVVTHVVFVLTI